MTGLTTEILKFTIINLHLISEYCMGHTKESSLCDLSTMPYVYLGIQTSHNQLPTTDLTNPLTNGEIIVQLLFTLRRVKREPFEANQKISNV